MVQGAVVFGRGREQAGILLEPRAQFAINPENEAEVAAFRNKVWYVVFRASPCAWCS